MCFDKTTAAVLRHLKEPLNSPDSEPTFDHLRAICYSAVKKHRTKSGKTGVLRLWDSWPEYHYNGKKENSEYDRLRTWIEEWLLKFLKPYRKLTFSELETAAKNDKFRYLGRQCIFDLIKAIRKKYPKDKIFHRVSVSLSAESDEGGGSLSEHVVAPANLNLNRAVATRFKVKERQARNLVHQFRAVVAQNASNPIIRELFEKLSARSSIVPSLAVAESADGRFRRQMCSQAGKDMAEFRREFGSPEVDAALADLQKEITRQVTSDKAFEVECSPARHENLQRVNEHLQLADSRKRELQQLWQEELVEGVDYEQSDLVACCPKCQTPTDADEETSCAECGTKFTPEASILPMPDLETESPLMVETEDLDD